MIASGTPAEIQNNDRVIELIWGCRRMLKINDLCVSYGGIEAVKGISLEVPEGSIVTLIGANGAGKSTTLRAISGLVPIKSGTIEFLGERIDGVPSEKLVAGESRLFRRGGAFFPI